MNEHDGHEHDQDNANGAHGHIPSSVKSAMGLLADGLDKARNMAGPAGDKARHVSDRARGDFEKVLDESAGLFDKVRDESAHVVNKLRGHSGPIDASNPNTGPTTPGSGDEMRDRAMEVLDIAKTVGAALLVGSVKVVQMAMREWHAHTGNASTPEDNVPAAAWDKAGTPRASADATTFPAPDSDTASSEPQPDPEVNNWDDVEAEVASDDGATGFNPVASLVDHVDVEEAVVYSSGPDVETEIGVALRAEAAPEHSGHSAAQGEAPLQGFDEMTIGSLRGRLGSLDLAALEALRDYERTHTARPQVLTMLENRIAKVTAHPAS